MPPPRSEESEDRQDSESEEEESPAFPYPTDPLPELPNEIWKEIIARAVWVPRGSACGDDERTEDDGSLDDINQETENKLCLYLAKRKENKAEPGAELKGKKGAQNEFKPEAEHVEIFHTEDEIEGFYDWINIRQVNRNLRKIADESMVMTRRLVCTLIAFARQDSGLISLIPPLIPKWMRVERFIAILLWDELDTSEDAYLSKFVTGLFDHPLFDIDSYPSLDVRDSDLYYAYKGSIVQDLVRGEWTETAKVLFDLPKVKADPSHARKALQACINDQDEEKVEWLLSIVPQYPNLMENLVLDFGNKPHASSIAALLRDRRATQEVRDQILSQIKNEEAKKKVITLLKEKKEPPPKKQKSSKHDH